MMAQKWPPKGSDAAAVDGSSDEHKPHTMTQATKTTRGSAASPSALLMTLLSLLGINRSYFAEARSGGSQSADHLIAERAGERVRVCRNALLPGCVAEASPVQADLVVD